MKTKRKVEEFSPPTNPAVRRKLGYGPIVRNRARCTRCSTVLESRHRHDFVSCACGNFVDGGSWYLRRGLGGDYPWDVLEDMSVYQEGYEGDR